MSEACELGGYLRAVLIASTHYRHIIAVALNERCSQLGRGHPAASSDDENGAH